MATAEKLTAPVSDSSRSVGRVPVASAKSMSSVPCPGLAETQPFDSAGGNANAREGLEAGSPQGSRDVDGRAGVDKQGHGAGVLRLTRDERAGAVELAVQVGYAGGVASQVYVEPFWRDEPVPFLSGRVSQAAALLLESAFEEYPSRLVEGNVAAAMT